MIIEVFTVWQVIAVCVFLMFILPLIFYIASCSRKPIRIKHKPVKSRTAEAEPSTSEEPEENEEGGEVPDSEREE